MPVHPDTGHSGHDELQTSEIELVLPAVDDFVAYRVRWRVALLFVISAAAVVLGMWMAGAFGEVPRSSRHSQLFLLALGWFSIFFFGA